ncbi:MAG: hypothetical protein AAB276_05290, partial [Pseudomonadota bacterium]
MSLSLIQVVEQIALNKLLNSTAPLVGRTSGEKIVMGLFALFLTLGLLFLVLALYLWLRATQTPELAAALTGAGACFMALILGGVQLYILWLKTRKIHNAKKEIESVLHEILTAATDEVEASVRVYPKASVLASACAPGCRMQTMR